MSRPIFGREPVVIINAVQAVLLVALAAGAPYLDAVSVPLIVAALGAVLGAVQAVVVRPVAPAAFTAVVTTLAPVLTHYGVGLSDELVVAVNGAIVAVLALATRQQVSPKDLELAA
ncbi:hypothetical protein ACOQFV_09130 [Nocardiopsis changdeensis]|uniref:Holin n=1 Tax=Nocardiopsis changdeensis TaxID=2831969 RepID=A0ABX8BDH0_9ACTN|nr:MULTISPECIES: hypothetical protein [Nocardiopsis]QUX20295.1 hypothetical protein KGD84_17350 [Nocardiopsis changdeensis]QYX36225.1 hypothetical protein K1J57_26805 [Nocardiopsis sp. MT53]